MNPLFLLLLTLPGTALALETPRILPPDDLNADPSHRVIWSTEPWGRYELQQSTDLEGWNTVPGFPRRATGSSDSHFFEAADDRLFFRVRLPDDAPDTLDGMVYVEGGTLAMSMGTQAVDSFHILRYPVTWAKWKSVLEWAKANGYSFVGTLVQGCADDHPAFRVSWYDALKWCNAYSEMQGLTPAYTRHGGVYREGDYIPDWNAAADGYRLPTEVEWEFAARGGSETRNYTYSGGNILNDVGWYRDNSSGAACNYREGGGTWPVGRRGSNELGLHDMSGNVWEWCWDRFSELSDGRIIRGGSWVTFAYSCSVGARTSGNPATPGGLANGFRLARSEAHHEAHQGQPLN